MALFGKEQATTGSQAQEQQTQNEQNMGDQNYFADYAGQGQDQFTADMLSTPYLSMAQPRGKAVKEKGMQPATWYNSASGENFGPTVPVICLAVKTAWVERDTVNKTWMTVGRYEPNSIEVVKTYPKPGQRGFPEMKNPETGNKVEELFVYALMLKESPESGVLFFSPTAISMSACKAWNTKIRNQRMLITDKATGMKTSVLAPIFAFSWNLTLALKESNGNENACLVSAEIDQLVAQDLFFTKVKPQLEVGQNLLAIAAPEADDNSAIGS